MTATRPTSCRMSLRRTFAILIAGAVLAAIYIATDIQGIGSRFVRVAHEIASGPKTQKPSSVKFSGVPVPDCGNYKDPGNIAVIVKTGATVITERLPTLLLTSLRCVADPLIFSDLEQDFGTYHVHDVLSNFTSKEGNPDFDLYRTQQEYVTSGKQWDLPKLGDLPIKSDDWRTNGKSAAWALDKYKFLHMVERAWQLRPDQDWYFFIEADTYISWANLLRWVPALDAHQRLYFGSAVRMYEAPYMLYFANGGSGMLLSGAAVSAFAGKGIAQRWDGRISKMWFGDYILAAALYEELDLKVTDARPTMIHDEPSIVLFHADIWCKPVVALHHLSSDEQNRLWQVESANNHSTLLFRDVYSIAYPSGLPKTPQAQWDNFAQDGAYSIDTIVDKPSTNGTFTVAETDRYHRTCQQACQQNDQCLQYLLHTRLVQSEHEGQSLKEFSCHLSRAFTLGKSRQAESSTEGPGSVDSWMSGWMSERITEWAVEHQSCAIDGTKWPGVR